MNRETNKYVLTGYGINTGSFHAPLTGTLLEQSRKDDIQETSVGTDKNIDFYVLLHGSGTLNAFPIHQINPLFTQELPYKTMEKEDDKFFNTIEKNDLNFSLNCRLAIERFLLTKDKSSVLIIIGEACSIYHAMKGFEIIAESDHRPKENVRVYEQEAFLPNHKVGDTSIGKLTNAHTSIANYSIPTGVNYEVWLEGNYLASERNYMDYENNPFPLLGDDYREPIMVYFPEDNVVCCWDLLSPQTSTELMTYFFTKLKEITPF